MRYWVDSFSGRNWRGLGDCDKCDIHQTRSTSSLMTFPCTVEGENLRQGNRRAAVHCLLCLRVRRVRYWLKPVLHSIRAKDLAMALQCERCAIGQHHLQSWCRTKPLASRCECLNHPSAVYVNSAFRTRRSPRPTGQSCQTNAHTSAQGCLCISAITGTQSIFLQPYNMLLYHNPVNCLRKT